MNNDIQDFNSVKFNWVGDWAKMRADIDSNSIAVYDYNQGVRLTFADINKRANLLANIMLTDFELSVGDTICVLSKNRIEYIDLFFACCKIGVILAPISFHIDREVVLEQVNEIKPAMFFHEHIFSDFTTQLELDLNPEKVINIDSFNERYAIARQDGLHASDITTPLALNDIAMLIATSGTSGKPKICKVSHRQILWNIFEVISYGYWAENNKELVAFPFYHFGGWNSFLCSFIYGRETVIINEFYSKYVCDVIQQEDITHFGGVNIMLDFIKDDELFENTPFERINSITLAGAPANPKLMNVFFDKGISVSQAYGLTESGPSNFTNPGYIRSLTQLKDTAETVGFPMLYCDYKITNPINVPDTDDTSKGIIALRSMHNFNGYINNDEVTNKTISKSGWINTSDIGSINKDNTVSILGRIESISDIFEDGGIPNNYDSLKMNWVGNTLSKRASIAPNETSLFDLESQKHLTLSKLDSITNQIANNLLEYSCDKFAISASPANQLLVFLAAAKAGKVVEIVYGNNDHDCDYLIIDSSNKDVSSSETINLKSFVSDSATAAVSTAKAMNETALVIDGKDITYNELYWGAFRLYTFAKLSAMKSFTIITDSFSSTTASLAFALINMGADLAIISSDSTKENASLVNGSDYLYIDNTVDENTAEALASSSRAELLFTNSLETNIQNKQTNKVLSNDGLGIVGFSAEKYGKQIGKSFPYTEV